MNIHLCLRCGHEWAGRGEVDPVQCPRCKSSYWNRERKDRRKEIPETQKKAVANTVQAVNPKPQPKTKRLAALELPEYVWECTRCGSTNSDSEDIAVVCMGCGDKYKSIPLEKSVKDRIKATRISVRMKMEELSTGGGKKEPVKDSAGRPVTSVGPA